MKNVVLSGAQRVGEDLEISADVLFSRRDVESIVNITGFGISNPVVDQKDLSGALNLDYEISEGWSLRVSPTSWITITFGSPERLAAVRASRRNRACSSWSRR